MLEVWDPISLPWGFDLARVSQLARQMGPCGVRLYAHWSGRSDLVTSKIESLLVAPAVPVQADYAACTLDLAANLRPEKYRDAIRDFADEVRRLATQGPVIYERVNDLRSRRVHLVCPFMSVAACGTRGLTQRAGAAPLTCKPCIRLAIEHTERVPHPLEFVKLSTQEIAHSHVVVMKTPRAVSRAPRMSHAAVITDIYRMLLDPDV